MKLVHVLRLGILVALFSLVFTNIIAQGDTIAPGDTIEATATGAIVPYTFEAVAGDSFTFSIEADFSAVITVEGPDGTVYVSNEDLRFTDLPMLFVAPEDGTYTLVVGSAFGEPEGAFTLQMAAVQVDPIAYGDSLALTPAEDVLYYFTFEAAEGDVLNVFANSEDDDTRLRILLPNGTEIAEDDDDGPGVDPYIRRFIVPADGSYIILLSAFSADRPMVTPVTLNLEQTELLPATSEPTTIELGGEIDGSSEVEVFTFEEAVAGNTYRVTVNAATTDLRLSVNVIQGDDTISSLNTSDFSRTSLDFVASNNGRVLIELDSSNFSGDPGQFEVTFAPVE